MKRKHREKGREIFPPGVRNLDLIQKVKGLFDQNEDHFGRGGKNREIKGGGSPLTKNIKGSEKKG